MEPLGLQNALLVSAAFWGTVRPRTVPQHERATNPKADVFGYCCYRLLLLAAARISTTSWNETVVWTKVSATSCAQKHTRYGSKPDYTHIRIRPHAINSYV